MVTVLVIAYKNARLFSMARFFVFFDIMKASAILFFRLKLIKQVIIVQSLAKIAL